MHSNPFEAPKTDAEPVRAVPSDVEATRRAHLHHEASVRSVGSLYLLGAVFFAFAVVFSLSAGVGANAATALAAAAIYAILAVSEGWTGWQLRQLNARGKIPGVIFAALGLLAFPVGTLISAYILYLLLSKKGQMVLSREYQAVIAATPHIKYRTSILVWVFVILIIAMLAAVAIPNLVAM